MTGDRLTQEEVTQIREHLKYSEEQFGTAISDLEIDPRSRQVTITFKAAYPDNTSYHAKISDDFDIPDYLVRKGNPSSEENGYSITYHIPPGESFVPR